MVLCEVEPFHIFQNFLKACGGVRKFISSAFERSINVLSLNSLHYTHQYHQHFYGNAMLKTTAQCFIMCTQLQCPYLHIHFLQIVLLYTENVPAFTYSNLRSTILEINCSLSTSVIIYPFFVYTCDC